MATYSQPTVAPTYRLSQAELIKRLDPQGNAAEIAEILNESNEIVQDVVFKEGNLPTGDEQTVRTGLPEVYWRQLNRGVPASHSTVATVTETCGQMEARSEVDSEVLNLNGMSATFRLQEEKPFIEAMTQAFAKTLFYGDAKKKSEGFTGLATRYSTLNKAKASCAKNVIDCGGTGDKLTSIYIVGWGDNVYCPFPKGSAVGLQSKDLGEHLIKDDQNNEFLGYTSIYDWKVGLMVRDWRYVVRLANINPDDLINGSGIGTGDVKTANTSNILMKLDQALTLIPRGAGTRLAMYMNSDVHYGLNVVAMRTDSNVIRYSEATEQFGAPETWTTYKNVPMRRCDQILNTETRVQ